MFFSFHDPSLRDTDGLSNINIEKEGRGGNTRREGTQEEKQQGCEQSFRFFILLSISSCVVLCLEVLILFSVLSFPVDEINRMKECMTANKWQTEAEAEHQ